MGKKYLIHKEMKKVINQSIDYILEHLNENITVKNVAGHFHFSEFYFSRLFKAETGESVYAFIKRLKMDQSAIDMKLKNSKSVTDIGLDYGYSSSNYSSAFKKHHSVSPVEFRKSANAERVSNPFNPEKIHIFKTYDDYAAGIKIEELADVRVIYERTIGDYWELKEKWIRFMETYKDCFNADTLLIERFYDDPSIASPNSCICDLCISADKEIYAQEKMATIKGGRFATYRFEGRVSDIFCTLQGIFRVWLPKSDYEMDERYGLNIYRKVNLDDDLVVMDLCIPIK